jgi:serine/threonine protein kinase
MPKRKSDGPKGPKEPVKDTVPKAKSFDGYTKAFEGASISEGLRNLPDTASTPDEGQSLFVMVEEKRREAVPAWLKVEFARLGYRIIKSIGEGGMGSIYEARYMGDFGALGIPENSQVAIKLLSDILISNPEGRTRFFREAELIRSINHPNMVKVYEVGEISNRPFFAMEYLDGTDVANLIKHKGADYDAIEVKRALYIAREVCSAMAEAHSKGIIHRDIKPENILIVKEDEGERIKVIDLGIARLARLGDEDGPKLTMAGQYFGTPSYMAPEMACESHGKVVYDHRVDIYALGVTMYAMVCGSLPFGGVDHSIILHLHRTKKPEPPSERRPDLDIPKNVDKVILKCLAKKPEDRFQSMEKLMKAIEACGIAPIDGEMLVRASKKPPKSLAKTAFRWALPIVLAAAAGAGTYLAVQPKTETEQTQSGKAYHARIETSVIGVSVMLEEKLEGGTVVSRLLGTTPLEVPLIGEQIIFLEHDGYKRAYVRVTPENSKVMHEMQKRE